MAKLPPRIKVFRTHIGFSDVVVATSSRKAALEAWDVSRDLFKTGEAEESNDPKAIAAALRDVGKAVVLPRAKVQPRAAVKKQKSGLKKTRSARR